MPPDGPTYDEAIVSTGSSLDSFQWNLRVRYHETDQQGIVFHSRYLEYFDVAMTEFFRALGWDYVDLVAAGCDPSLVTTTIDFRQPARFEDTVAIAVTPIKIGQSSFTLAFSLKRDSEELVTAQTVYVNIDTGTMKSRAIPVAVRARLTEHLPEAAA